jgi:membrane-bound metal-dependent hydrolase YbcI (DUF457 family)
MQTYSHFLITAVLGERLRKREIPVATKALLAGSILPDIPLALLTAGYAVYRRWINPDLMNEFIFGPTYDRLYFSDPLWVSGHSLMHAPLLILLYAGIGYWLWRRGGRRERWGTAVLWFAAGCGLHSLIDILTHVHDGPLLLFPFNRQIRFPAPVSYWDPQHGGRIFGPLEHLLDLGLLSYLLIAWWGRRRRETDAVSSAD